MKKTRGKGRGIGQVAVLGGGNIGQAIARGLVQSGLDEGAELYQPECRIPERGFWFPPTLFTNVSQSYRIAREEIFGPVLSVLTFRTPAEAVEKANNTPYGLSAGECETVVAVRYATWARPA